MGLTINRRDVPWGRRGEDMDSFRLDGRVALVTGASRGIAAAIVEVLAEYGAAVAIHYSSAFDAKIGHPDAAEKLKQRCESLGVKATTVDCDISERDAVRRIVASASDALGPIDIAVSSASMQVVGKLADFDQDLVDAHFRMNYMRTLELAQETVPGMAERGWGRFLAIGSVQQYLASTRMPIYASTKAAQVSLVQYLANAYGPNGVNTNSISPGLVATDRNAFRREDEDEWQALQKGICPLQRAGTPEDIKGAALLLCSDAGGYINGADIQVNGGMLLRAAD